MKKPKKTPEISVIMPIYNAATYLNTSVESVLCQTFDNFELLLINDGSTDDSKSICERYAESDNRIKLINQINTGVSSARNIGVKLATGKYIIHADADDILISDALYHLIKKIKKNNADIVVADFIVKKGSKENLIETPLFYDSEELLKKIITGQIHSGLWNKLINKECYTSISFDKNINYMEDKLILTKILLTNPKVINLNRPVYIYNQHNLSITNKINADSLISMENVIKKIECLLCEKSEYKQSIKCLKLNFKIALLNNSENSFEIIGKFDEVNPFLFQTNSIPFHYKIMLWLEFQNITLGTKIFKMLKKWI